MPLLSVLLGRTRLRAIKHRLQSVSIGVGDEQAYMQLFQELSIVYSLSSRNSQNSHPHCFVSRTKSRAKKIEMRQNSDGNLRKKLLRERRGTCSEIPSFTSGTFNELSGLLLSPLEFFLNSFQNSIPILSRRNKTNESVDVSETFQSINLILN